MITEVQLREKLKHWLREYGWGGMPSERAANLLHTLIDHQGFVPSARGYVGVALQTVGDEVEAAVQAMESTPALSGDENVLFKGAMVLRAHYLTPKNWPEEERLRRLREIGLQMSRANYYKFLQVGKVFLQGYLSSGEKKVA